MVYLIHIFRLLQNLKVINKAVIFYTKTGSRYLKSIIQRFLKEILENLHCGLCCIKVSCDLFLILQWIKKERKENNINIRVHFNVRWILFFGCQWNLSLVWEKNVPTLLPGLPLLFPSFLWAHFAPTFPSNAAWYPTSLSLYRQKGVISKGFWKEE